MAAEWHFGPGTRAFLAGLRDNNRKDWFEAHRDAYRADYLAAGAACGDVLGAVLERLTGRRWEAKAFRIHQDQRFHAHRPPYKAHLHMLFREVPVRGLGPALFFGIEPDRAVFGGGVLAFEPAALARFRAAVLGEGGTRLAAAVASGGLTLWPPELKRPPAGVPADHPRADLARHKALVAMRPDHPGSVAEDAGFTALARGEFAALLPVADWLSAVG